MFAANNLSLSWYDRRNRRRGIAADGDGDCNWFRCRLKAIRSAQAVQAVFDTAA
jgi:hypothetical protein